jgi:hypothetical protein
MYPGSGACNLWWRQRSEHRPLGAARFIMFAPHAPGSDRLEGASLAFRIDKVPNREYRIWQNGLIHTGIAADASAAVEF